MMIDIMNSPCVTVLSVLLSATGATVTVSTFLLAFPSLLLIVFGAFVAFFGVETAETTST
jgi:hypothetical protein